MRLVGFDLECTHLSGMIGRILCCSFKPITPNQDAKVYTFRADKAPYRQKDIIDDGQLAVSIRDELEKFDIIVGHNSKLFDVKFLNARLLKVGERPLKPMWHIDTMWVVRTKFRISSKLDNVQQFMGLPDQKTPISWDQWSRGAAFDSKAMNDIVTHCEQDVKVLEQAYWRLLPSIARLEKK
jgi:DNA polymerase III epsilon subunit-like protein